LCGAALMLLSGGALVTVDQTLARYEGSVRHADLFGDAAASKQSKVDSGPLNILLAGIDPRSEDEVPRADSVMVLHVAKERDRAYLFSLPRDLLVAIPAFPKAGYQGTGTEKLAHAMFFGAQTPAGQLPNIPAGFELLAQTVAGYTGIERFDAGAIIDFGGFNRVIDAMGGVDLEVDQEVRSLHLRPDGTGRAPAPVGFTGPQMIYHPGWRHFNGWQALDYSRQRYTEGGDYARQRHQQQLVRAIVAKAFSADMIAHPARLDEVLRSAGRSLIFSGRGIGLAEWAFALRDLRPENLTLIHLVGGGQSVEGQYQGEVLQTEAFGFFDSLLNGTVDSYVVEHPEMISNVA
jgi:LCP family protein required for cell wall assembly